MFKEKLQKKLSEKLAVEPIVYEKTFEITAQILTFDLSSLIDSNSIIDKILNYKNNYPHSNKSNVKAWHSDYMVHLRTNDFNELISIVEDRVEKSINNRGKVKVVESWIAAYQKGDKTILHDHRDQPFSAVYYAKAENDVAPIKFDSKDHFSIIPKTGMLICFPGYVPHYVPELTSDQERICIAFNLQISWSDIFNGFKKIN